MIKIKNNISKDTNCDLMKTITDPALIAYLEKEDISIGDYEDYDYVFEEANPLADEKRTVLPRTIAFERIDGCQIRNKILLHSDNLYKLVKMYMYPSLELNNTKTVDGRIFTRLLVTESKYNKEAEPVTQKMFDKVTVGFSFWHYLKHDFVEQFLDANEFPRNREIIASFLGTTQYGNSTHKSGNLITGHRLSCIDAINGLAVNKVATSPNRELEYIEYLKLLYDSKIVVSPWGWGESCYRDYEAIVCGCELIKPESYTIQSSPDIYNTSYMHFCKADWSNLEEVVYKLLGEYNRNEPIRLMRSENLVMLRSMKKKVKIISDIVKG